MIFRIRITEGRSAGFDDFTKRDAGNICHYKETRSGKEEKKYI